MNKGEWQGKVYTANNGDKYTIHGDSKAGYNITLWNAAYRLEISDFNPKFTTLRAARDYVIDRA